MKRLVFWLDFISPFAYLAFERLPDALQGLSYEVEYRPVLFAGMLSHFGNKGPAELEPKRAWTFRHVHWLAHRHGIPMDTPAAHPFNPLALLRLAWACAPEGSTPNRRVCEAVFRHVWRGGADAADPDRLAELTASLAPPSRPADDEIKRRLRAATDDALALGIFGVPTLQLGERLFWGFEALPMVAACLSGDPWFDGPAWDREGRPRPGIVRG
jgi:2-hydroxychromene-2-carboxylate isomerase